MRSNRLKHRHHTLVRFIASDTHRPPVNLPLNIASADRGQHAPMPRSDRGIPDTSLQSCSSGTPVISSARGRSAMSAAPLSQAITCCVCNASRAVLLVGRDSAHRAIGMQRLRAPKTATRAATLPLPCSPPVLGSQRATRGLCVEERNNQDFGSGADRKRMVLAHSRRQRETWQPLQKMIVHIDKNERRARNDPVPDLLGVLHRHR